MVTQGVTWVQGALLLHLSMTGVTSFRVGTGRRAVVPSNLPNNHCTTTTATVVARRPLRSLPSDMDFVAAPDDDDDIASALGDDDESLDEEDDEDGDADDDDGSDDDGAVDGADKEGLWQERRLSKKEERERKAMAIRAKLTWEEKYEDDPLRSDTPAKVRLPPPGWPVLCHLCWVLDILFACPRRRTSPRWRIGTSARTWPWQTCPTPPGDRYVQHCKACRHAAACDS